MVWYLSFYYQVSFAPDLSILVSFAERMMQGELYSESYYDTNPPMSMIIFIPPVWVANLTGWPVYHVHFFYSLILMALSFALTAYLLKRIKGIERPERHLLLMIYVLTQIFAPDRSIGDREHIIVLGLVPFMLTQICLTRAIGLPTSLKYLSLAFGTLGVLIKPHYVIFPAIFFAHRLWTTRNLKMAIMKADFYALLIGALAYALILVAIFPDYLSVVLPDVIELYLWQKHPLVWTESMGYSLVLAFFFFGTCMGNMNEKQYNMLLALCVLTLASFIPYILQAKALNYQRIPYLTFLYLACGYALYLVITNKFKPAIGVFCSVLLAGLFLYMMRSVPIAFPTHQEFKNLPLSQAIEKHCEKPCSYLFWYDYSDIVHQLAIYHDAYHASRFTSNWFSPRIVFDEQLMEQGLEPSMSGDEREAYREKYTNMVLQDMERFNPSIIMAIRKENNPDDLDFFLKSEAFQKQFDAYQKVDDFSFKRMLYYPGYHSSAVGEPPIHFEVYKRKDLVQ